MKSRSIVLLGAALVVVPWIAEPASAQNRTRTPTVRKVVPRTQAPAVPAPSKPDIVCSITVTEGKGGGGTGFADSGEVAEGGWEKVGQGIGSGLSVYDGDGPIWANVRVENVGPGDASQSSARVIVRRDGQVVDDVVRAVLVPTPGGASTTQQLEVPIHLVGSQPSFQITAIVDHGQENEEVEERNNRCQVGFEVRRAVDPDPAPEAARAQTPVARATRPGFPRAGAARAGRAQDDLRAARRPDLACAVSASGGEDGSDPISDQADVSFALGPSVPWAATGDPHLWGKLTVRNQGSASSGPFHGMLRLRRSGQIVEEVSFGPWSLLPGDSRDLPIEIPLVQGDGYPIWLGATIDAATTQSDTGNDTCQIQFTVSLSKHRGPGS